MQKFSAVNPKHRPPLRLAWLFFLVLPLAFAGCRPGACLPPAADAVAAPPAVRAVESGALASAAHPGRLLEASDLLHRRFELARVDGAPWSPPGEAARPDLEFNDGGQLAGRVCNRFRGPFTVQDGVLRAENLASTMMLCIHDDLGQLETLLFAMLREGAALALDEETQSLSLEGGGHALVYARADWVR